MPQVMPAISRLTIHSGPPRPIGGSGVAAPSAPPPHPPLDPALLALLFQRCLPHLPHLSLVDLSEADVHTSPELWAVFVGNLPKGRGQEGGGAPGTRRGGAGSSGGGCGGAGAGPLHVVMREPTSWWSPRCTLTGSGLPGGGRGVLSMVFYRCYSVGANFLPFSFLCGSWHLMAAINPTRRFEPPAQVTAVTLATIIYRCTRRCGCCRSSAPRSRSTFRASRCASEQKDGRLVCWPSMLSSGLAPPAPALNVLSSDMALRPPHRHTATRLPQL